ncbi:MAG: hypothetical protein R3C52_12510 [Hyphomonadaceae bacterium]
MVNLARFGRVGVRCGVAAAALSFMIGGAALAQSGGGAEAAALGAPGYVAPKTSWGVPDLQGTWSNASITDLQRNPKYPGLVLSREQANEIEGSDYYNNRTREDSKPADVKNLKLLDGTDLLSGGGYNAFWVDQGTRVATVKGELRSSWITHPADGRIPYLPGKGPRRRTSAQSAQPTGAAAKSGTVQGPGSVDPNAGGGYGSYNGPETRPLGERCLVGFGNTGGPVMNNVLYNNHYQLVQSPDTVMILVEMVHDARVIPIVSGPEAADWGPDPIRPWLGKSVGWYEGDALVIETRKVNPQQRGYLSQQGVLRERLYRWNDKQVVYEFEVTDPSLYSEPWGGEIAWNLSAEPLYEYACHEGNYAMPGILAGARKLESEGRLVPINADEE